VIVLSRRLVSALDVPPRQGSYPTSGDVLAMLMKAFRPGPRLRNFRNVSLHFQLRFLFAASRSFRPRNSNARRSSFQQLRHRRSRLAQ